MAGQDPKVPTYPEEAHNDREGIFLPNSVAADGQKSDDDDYVVRDAGDIERIDWGGNTLKEVFDNNPFPTKPKSLHTQRNLASEWAAASQFSVRWHTNLLLEPPFLDFQ
jgi:hypothetical protein